MSTRTRGQSAADPRRPRAAPRPVAGGDHRRLHPHDAPSPNHPAVTGVSGDGIRHRDRCRRQPISSWPGARYRAQRGAVAAAVAIPAGRRAYRCRCRARARRYRSMCLAVAGSNRTMRALSPLPERTVASRMASSMSARSRLHVSDTRSPVASMNRTMAASRRSSKLRPSRARRRARSSSSPRTSGGGGSGFGTRTFASGETSSSSSSTSHP